MDISETYDKVQQYWEEHLDEIQRGEGGYNYILKMLYKSLNYNSRASCRTVACRTAHDIQVEHTMQRYLEISRDSLAAAICEVIDSDFESRIEAGDEE